MIEFITWLIFIVLLVAICVLIFFGIKNKKILMIILGTIISIFYIYSFFTTRGSIRLAIVIMGHPISAYTTDFKESFTRGNNNKYFTPTKDIQITSGSMLDIECKSYGIIKISTYYGF